MLSPPSPVPQALSLAWHAEAIPVVGEVAANKQDKESKVKLGRLIIQSTFFAYLRNSN